jgi:hypothetical protein
VVTNCPAMENRRSMSRLAPPSSLLSASSCIQVVISQANATIAKWIWIWSELVQRKVGQAAVSQRIRSSAPGSASVARARMGWFLAHDHPHPWWPSARGQVPQISR